LPAGTPVGTAASAATTPARGANDNAAGGAGIVAEGSSVGRGPPPMPSPRSACGLTSLGVPVLDPSGRRGAFGPSRTNRAGEAGLCDCSGCVVSAFEPNVVAYEGDVGIVLSG